MNGKTVIRKQCLATLLAALLLGISQPAVASSISVLPEAARRGDRGMRVILDETKPGYVQDDTPAAEARYRARFFFRADALALEPGDALALFAGYQTPDTKQFEVRVRREAAQLRLSYGAAGNGGGWVMAETAAEAVISDGWHIVEIDWRAGAGDGFLKLWFDVLPLAGLSNLSNNTGTIDYVRLGALEGPATANAGYLDVDDFISRQVDYIGAPPEEIGIGDVRVNINAPDTIVTLTGAFNDPEDGLFGLAYSLPDNTNPALFTAVTLDNPSSSLTLDYAPDATGTAVITLRATDSDALYSDISFTVLVNGPPATTGIADVSAMADAADAVINLFDSFSDVEDTDAALTYTLEGNTNAALFTSVMVDDTAGTLTIDYNEYAWGESTITIRATDTGGLFVDAPFLVTVERVVLEFHTADQNQDNLINLSELLRVIQFFNSAGLSCANPPESTEDGYLAGPGGTQDCRRHASDYKPADWMINLSELLRVIQFFNSGGYSNCAELEPATEDGYCVGPAK